MIAALARPWIVGAAALLLGLTFGYGWGRLDGRSAGKVEQLEATVSAIEKRGKIDEDVSNLDRYRICLELGGLRDDCAALRGSDAAASGQ